MLTQNRIVRIGGLKKATSLNGLLAKTIKYHDSRERWEVESELGKTVAIKAMNIEAVSDFQAIEILGKNAGKQFIDVTEAVAINNAGNLNAFLDQLSTILTNLEDGVCIALDMTKVREIFPSYYRNWAESFGHDEDYKFHFDIFEKGKQVCTIFFKTMEDLNLKQLRYYVTKEENDECCICFEPWKEKAPAPSQSQYEITVFACNRCLVRICTECYPRLTTLRCPACKTGWIACASNNSGSIPLHESEAVREERLSISFFNNLF